MRCSGGCLHCDQDNGYGGQVAAIGAHSKGAINVQQRHGVDAGRELVIGKEVVAVEQLLQNRGVVLRGRRGLRWRWRLLGKPDAGSC